MEGSGSSNSIRIAAAREAIAKRQSQEFRKLRENYNDEINEVRTKNEKEISKFKKDYELKMSTEKTEAEIKLSKLRNQYSKQIEVETERFKKLLEDLRQTNSDRLMEAQKANEQQVARQEVKHNEYLEKARLKFEEEKAKLES